MLKRAISVGCLHEATPCVNNSDVPCTQNPSGHETHLCGFFVCRLEGWAGHLRRDPVLREKRPLVFCSARIDLTPGSREQGSRELSLHPTFFAPSAFLKMMFALDSLIHSTYLHLRPQSPRVVDFNRKPSPKEGQHGHHWKSGEATRLWLVSCSIEMTVT